MSEADPGNIESAARLGGGNHAERTASRLVHPPAVVFVMLLVLVMASSFLASHAMAAGRYRGWLRMLCFGIVLSAAVSVIVDFEFPRLGLIRVDSFDQLLVDLRASMK